MSPTAEQISQATKTGSPSQIVEALEYILEYQHSACYAVHAIYSESVLQSLLNESYPVIICRGWYYNGQRNGGHAWLIIDYRWNTSINDYEYVLLDPSPVNSGKIYALTYEAICNGENAIDPNEKDNGIWESVVVYEKGNYSNFIHWPGVS